MLYELNEENRNYFFAHSMTAKPSKQRHLKYKPLQKQLLVCNRSCKQNQPFKNAIKGGSFAFQGLFKGQVKF